MDESAQAAAVARVLRPGTRLGRYTLVRRLGHGGMAELYLARVTGPGGFRKHVALKLVLPHLATDPAFVEMFLNEARIAGMLDHPHIAAVHELGQEQGEYFIAMEYVDGRDLRTLLARAAAEGGMPLACGLSIVAAVASALHYAHEARDVAGKPLQIVHRDVSPSNILVRHDGCVKLVDFGIAKAVAQTSATRSGVLKGKIGYMSPEQCLGNPIDRRADVFGLGVLLYEVTTCRRLFVGDNEFATMNRIVKGELRPPREVQPAYPEALEQIVLRALQTDPRLRHPSALALLQDLEAFATEAKLTLSPSQLAEWMQAHGFGEAGEAEVLQHVDTSAPPPVAVEPRARRLGGTLRTIGGVLVGAAAAAWLMRPEPAGDDGAEPATTPVTVEPAAAVDATPTPDRTPPARVEPVARRVAPTEADPIAPQRVEPTAKEALEEPEPKKRAASRRSHARDRRAGPRQKPSKPTKAQLDEMFPGGS